MSRRVVSCRAVPCLAVPCRAATCPVVLCHAVPHRAMLSRCCAVLYSVVPRRVMLCYTTLFCGLWRVALYCTASCRAAPLRDSAQLNEAVGSGRLQTMHRQQRLRSPSSSPSLQSLPRVSPARSSATNVLLSPASTSTSTLTSASTPTLTPTPRSIASATNPTSSIALPTSSTWSTSKLSPFVWNVQQTSCSSLALLSNESSILTSSSALSSPPPPPPPPSSSSSTIPLPVPCPRLVSVLAWSMTLLLVTSCIGLTDAGILNGHPLGKRSFIDIQCKGIYDKSIFARLDRICEDCYNLFREPQLHQLCRKNCFTSDYFKGCLDVLLLQDEVEKIQTWIKQLHGAEPGV
ncbi:ion transport peptide isoform X1 [Halictus rubicundus]|uniref:ion transport peptide isoform X1 n=2 Tax=Halictus rubicundus TaxID=77578 RepID=UPI004035A8F4